MRSLTVLYDATCGFCERCRRWLESQPVHVPMRFIAAGSPEAVRAFPDLAAPGVIEELIAVSDDGDVYRNDAAWLICLYATRRHRHWSYRLASPALRPLARDLYRSLSGKRHAISRLIGHRAESLPPEPAKEGPCSATSTPEGDSCGW